MVNKGDQTIAHIGSIGGVSMTAQVVQDDPEEFREWCEGREWNDDR